MQNVPFLDLKAQHAPVAEDMRQAVLAVLDSGQFVLGPAVQQFEKTFAEYCGVEEAVAVNSGTSALHLALLAAGIGPGDEVITTTMTFVATVAAIVYSGATPVFADIDPMTWNLDPAKVEEKITPRTKAIMPVHLHGLMADVDRLEALAAARGLVLIEDAAQSHGAARGGRGAGTVGRATGFSFYPGKNLGAAGEGGAAVTNDPEVAKKMRMLRDWGQSQKYHHDLHGFNYRMDGIQGAVLNVKMNHIERWTEGRRAAAARYETLLADLPVQLPQPPADARHVYHVYAVRVKDRDQVMAKLGERGIGTGIHYPIPVHLQPAYAQYSSGEGSFPEAEAVAREFLSLPMYPDLTADLQKRVAEALGDSLG